MTTYVALLRGVNVGGRSLAMEALAGLFVDLGHTGVQTYIQSGNVVFSSSRTDQPGLAAEIESRLEGDFSLRSPVVLRSATQLGSVARAHPFDGPGIGPTTLHVTFLAAVPELARVADLEPPAAAGERWSVAGREVFLHCPDGYGRTKLTNAFFERRLGVAATTRNWNTVLKLHDLCRR